MTRVARLLREERLDALVGLGDRGRSSGRGARRHARSATARPLRPGRGDPHRPLLRRGDADAADPPEAGRRRAARRGSRRDAVGPSRARPESAPEAPATPPRPGQKPRLLDLREPTDLERSHLLHRLDLLGVAWGEIPQASGKGTFKEAWQLQWKPELAVALIEASLWGTTVETRGLGQAVDEGDALTDLPA